MPKKPDCRLNPIYDNDGGLRKGKCDCGAIFYSYTADPRRKNEALKIMEGRFREHYGARYGPLDV